MNTAVILAAALVLLSTSAGAQPAGNTALRIVVVEGEDAVNIVQQKTAVAPVIEVRDRNNLPVPGALVTFSIQSGNAATLGGASTLTVATNAAGQAAVTGLTPTAAGAFQIQVSAAFQGQVATATIAQTNVMTAAQAAAASAATGGASGSSAGGGAAGGAGGGGLSPTMLAVTGAAVAGGALAALQGGANDDVAAEAEVFTGSFTGQTTTVTSRTGSAATLCVVTRAITATVRFEIDDAAGDKVVGRMTITGTDRFISNTCPFTQGEDPVNWSVAVDGADSAIRGNNASTFSNSCCQGTHTTSFEGARSGEGTITGELKTEVRFTSRDAEGNQFDHLTTGSFPLTLTKTTQ
jgi:hypothetical protein